jgi:hypothetical protein
LRRGGHLHTYGSTWDSTALVKLENGTTRRLDFAHVLLLAAALGVPATELVPDRGDEWVRLGPVSAVRAGKLRALLVDGPGAVKSRDFLGPPLPPAPRFEDDVERAAARSLGVEPWEAAVASLLRYGRKLAQERDRRLAMEDGADVSPRSRQARRGHITRALVAELRGVDFKALRAMSLTEQSAAIEKATRKAARKAAKRGREETRP